MQKGHTRRVVSLTLFCVLIAILLILSSVAFTQSPRSKAVGPLLTLPGAVRLPLAPGESPLERCSTCPGDVGTEQAPPGPDPDTDMTANATASQELEPNTAPIIGQNRIAFVSNGEDLDDDGFIDPTLPADPGYTPDFDLWLMRPDGTQQQKVIDLPGDQRDPAYDPGGRLLAYASNQSGTYQIYTVEVSTGVIWQITTTEGNKRHPTWSSDSNWVAFTTDRNGASNWDIFKIRSNGAGSEIPLAVAAGNQLAPAWSPTAAAIAYQSAVGNVDRIFSMDTEGGNVIQLSDGGGSPTASDIDPAWSPNGQSMVFASSRFTELLGDTTDDFNIYTMSRVGEAETGQPATLVSNDEDALDDQDDVNPTWTPDLDERARTRFVFESTRADAAGEEPDIWATFLSDTMPPELRVGPGRDNALPWVDNRNPGPGADITVKVAVYDADGGVGSVTALFKDPELKIFEWSVGVTFESSITGDKALEVDCTIVGSAQMLDDGVSPDEVAGDGIYTATWTTLPTARDYIIDIATTDIYNNSMTYDDIYGFSTVTFNPNDRILFVDDYCEGQLFISLTGNNNDWPYQYPVESYYRLNPGGTLEPTVDFDSIAGRLPAYNYPRPTSFDPDGYYDVWRVICRGPVSDTILRNYLPTVEYQLDPADALANPTTAKATRAVQVANRAIVWAAPKTGDVWIADGTIMDASVQARLGNFLAQGGKLFISGEDLAWALTMAGRTNNDFLSNHLRAQYLQDDVGVGGDNSNSWAAGESDSPVAGDAWYGTGSLHRNNYRAWYDANDEPTILLFPGGPVNSPDCWCDAADQGVLGAGIRADGITPIGEDTKLCGYHVGQSGGFGGTGAGTAYHDLTTGAHVVFLAFGIETVYRDYITSTTPPSRCLNHRSHLIHNFLCWSRSATVQGRVVSISEGGVPVTDPEPIVVITQNENRWAVRCQKDGTYVAQGLKSGEYDVEAIRVGYEIDHADGTHAHGGENPVQIDFAIKEAQPGAISGIVLSETTDDFIANVTVSVYPVPVEEEEEVEPGDPPAAAVDPNDFMAASHGDEPGSARNTVATASLPVRGEQTADYDIDDLGEPIAQGVSAADGTFVIPGVPVGDYVIVADGTVVGYGTAQQQVDVTPGNTTNVVFRLGAAPGTLSVHVTDVNDQSDIANATVVVSDANAVEAGRATTDTSGIANLSLPAGQYTVIVSAPGYETSTPKAATVTSQVTSNLEVQLDTVPAGGISGVVASATTGSPVGGILIRVMSGGVVIASTVTSDTLTNPGDGSPSYNYIFDPEDPTSTGVPAGEVTVVPVVSGYTPSPTQRTETVQSGQMTTGVSFVLESLHVFPAGYQLMSLPWDFSSMDPAALLGVTAGSLRMATWETGAARYRAYPNAPADRFRLGRGYWLNLAGAADLAQEGTPATSPYSMRLEQGWNLIGDPFTVGIDFYSVTVRDRNGVDHTMAEALASNIIGSRLFAYMLGGYRTVSAFIPYVGYWLLVNDSSCTLIIDRDADALAVSEEAAASTAMVDVDGWQLQLNAEVAGLADTATCIATSTAASEGYDAGLDQGKPPVPGMGPYVYATLQGSDGGNLAVDVRGANAAESRWNLVVDTNLAGQQVELSWPAMHGLPANVQPMLIDAAAGKRVYMRTNRSYCFTAGETARQLSIVVSSDPVGQLAVAGASASAGAEGVSVSYTLSKAASVSVEVRNIAGRLVGRAAQNELQTTGLQSVVWNCRNIAGAKVPAGRYLISIAAATEDGQRAQGLTSVIVTR